MMSMEIIREMSRDAAKTAAAEGKVPFMVETEDLEDWRAMMEMGRTPQMPFPMIGDLEPAGWENMDEDLFVDSSGMGSAGEPALTARQMIMDELQPGYGYAITQAGQFQVYVGKFRKL